MYFCKKIPQDEKTFEFFMDDSRPIWAECL